MYLYLIFSICLLLALGEGLNIKIKDSPKFYSKSYWCLIFLFILISTLRWENGTDWVSYYTFFNQVKSPTILSWFEPGFTLLSSTNSAFTDYTFHLGCLAILSIYPIAYRLPQYSTYPLISLLVWFSISFANIFPVRQSVAISLFFFSWLYINNKDIKKFLICIFFASTFHYTAIFAIPIYFIWHKTYSKKFFILTIGVISIISFASQELISKLLYTIGGSFFTEKLDTYLSNSEEAFGALYSPREVLLRGIINRSFFFITVLLLLDKKRRKSPYLNGAVIMYWYSFLLFLVTTPLSVGLSRITSFTDMSQLVIVPYIFQLRMTKISKVIIFCIIALYFLIRFKGVVENYHDLYIPYNLVLFK